MAPADALCDDIIDAASRGATLEDAVELMQRHAGTSRQLVEHALERCRAIASAEAADAAFAARRAVQLLETALQAGLFRDWNRPRQATR